MAIPDSEVTVIGSSFSGTLSALILNRLGYRVAVFDRQYHPRFAIGESSTPAADLVFAALIRRFGISGLEPLANYGSWKKHFPEIDVGLKRGFSFFTHWPDCPFRPEPDGSDQLLVAASLDNLDSDTHWYRPDVDARIASRLTPSGVSLNEGMSVRQMTRDHSSTDSVCWRIGFEDSEGSRIDWTTSFVVDASGAGGVVPRLLGVLPIPDSDFETRTAAVFGHFSGLADWDTLVPRSSRTRHPFPYQHAAIHHLLEEGWLWQLPFDSGVTSCGLVLDLSESGGFPVGSIRTGTDNQGAHPASAEAIWKSVLGRYPDLESQLGDAQCVAPQSGLGMSPRLQRGWSRLGGTGWVVLPGTAGFVDPLFSSGIAQNLLGLEFLAEQWSENGVVAPDDHAAYSKRFLSELGLIDRLVGRSLRARRQFPLFVRQTMIYFLLAVEWEQRRVRGDSCALLCSDDDHLMKRVMEAHSRLESLAKAADCSAAQHYDRWFRQEFVDCNHAELLDPAAGNMYRFTAAPRWRTVD